MINNIAQIAKINSILNKMSTDRFNAILPTKIDVLEELNGGKYKLLIGTKVIDTKSQLKLDVGSSYWGEMKENLKSGSITLTQLLKQPKLLKNLSNLPRFDVQTLGQLLTKESPKGELKMILLENLANSSSKSEFMTVANMLQGINESLFSFVLNHNNKDAIFQFKKRKKRHPDKKDEDTKIDFYAAFENLGPIEGVVEVIDGVRRLSLYLYYENSLAFLKRELASLDLEAVLYKKDKSINPLFSVTPALLDIKG
ncbi:MAG TPA: hypothetical protein EYG69_00365 [Campylobacterales bacterium]|nr:hypothetical protein [Campylobacterales bacterium]